MDDASLSLAIDGNGELIADEPTKAVLVQFAKKLQPYCACPITEYEVGVAVMLIPPDATPNPYTMQTYAEWVYLRRRLEPGKPITIPEAKAIEASGKLPSSRYALLTLREETGTVEMFLQENAKPFLAKAASALEQIVRAPVQAEQVAGAIALTMSPGTYVLGRDIDLEDPPTLHTLARALDRLRCEAGPPPRAEHPKGKDYQ